jgi:Holliday junction DNA helicase RuvB
LLIISHPLPKAARICSFHFAAQLLYHSDQLCYTMISVGQGARQEVTVSEERVVTAKLRGEDRAHDSGLRPRSLDEFIGQPKLKENLRILIDAADGRGEALDHVLFHGPPGLGKTTLAHILAHEMRVKITVTSGPAIERAGDLAAIITNLGERDILFIDEVHRLSRPVEERLYPAMEDYALDIVIGKGPSAKTIHLPLPRITVVGATTRIALLTAPLRERFGVLHRLDFYGEEAMRRIVKRSGGLLGVEIDEGGVEEIAKRARGTPRVANRFLRRVRDYAQVRADGVVTREVAQRALSMLEVDDLGLDDIDRRVIEAIIVKFSGGPVGIDTIAACISEEPDTIMDVYEPYLLQLGFIDRTPRGRVATKLAYGHLGIPYDKEPPQARLL